MYETETNFKDPSYEGSPLTNIRDNFASQTEVKLKATSHDLQRIGAVVEGLKRVYDNVATRAAEGMAMTPQEAADVNMAVTGMADTVDVECQTLSVENFADPYGAHISTTISMEGIKDAILKGLKRIGEIIVKLITHLIDWFMSKGRALKEAIRKTRHTRRAFTQILTTIASGLVSDRMASLKAENIQFLLLDGNIPQNIGGEMKKFFASCGEAAENTGDAIDRVDVILDAVFTVLSKQTTASGGSSASTAVGFYDNSAGSRTTGMSQDDVEIAIGVEIGKSIKYGSYRELKGTRKVKTSAGGELRIGPALIGNHILIYSKPESNEADDLAQDGSLVTTIARAEEKYGIKTGYTSEMKSKIAFANIVTDLGGRGVDSAIDLNFNKVFDIENKLKSSRNGIMGKLTQLNTLFNSDSSDNNVEAGLQYVRAVSKMLRLQQENLASTITVLTDNMDQFRSFMEDIVNFFNKNQFKTEGYKSHA